jgi:hypothetical protein
MPEDVTQQPVREILRQLRNNPSMGLPRDGFDETKWHYCWEHTGGSSQPGFHINLAEMVGWRKVHGDDPENRQLRDDSGHCRLADVVLMKIPRERWEELQREKRRDFDLARGIRDEEEMRDEINEQVSKLVGYPIKVAFDFAHPSQLVDRKK